MILINFLKSHLLGTFFKLHTLFHLFVDSFQFVMILGAHSTTRDAGKINFRAVHVVAQVAPHKPCRSNFISRIAGNTR